MSACACRQEGGLIEKSMPVVVEGVAHGLDKCVGLGSGQTVPARHKDTARTLVLSMEQRDRVRKIEGLLYGGGAGHPEGDVWFLMHLVDALVMRLAAVELEKP